MLDELIHVNSRRDVLNFNQLGIYANYNDLRDYEWQYTSTNNKISSFSRAIKSKTIPFVFACNEKQAIEIKNKFYEHFDVDVLNQSCGYFQIGEYKYYCYVIKSVKSKYLINKGYLEIKLEIVTDKPYWIREESTILPMGNIIEPANVAQIKKYDYSYGYKYSSLRNAKVIHNGFSKSDVIIRFFGVCENPYVKIGEKNYMVNASCDNGEYIEIDTQNKTIYRVAIDGSKTNLFHYRDKSKENFFERVDEGDLSVTWNGIYKIEVVLVETRGEPKWI